MITPESIIRKSGLNQKNDYNCLELSSELWICALCMYLELGFFLVTSKQKQERGIEMSFTEKLVRVFGVPLLIILSCILFWVKIDIQNRNFQREMSCLQLPVYLSWTPFKVVEQSSEVVEEVSE